MDHEDIDQRKKDFQLKLKEKEDAARNKEDDTSDVSVEELKDLRKRTKNAIKFMLSLLPKLDESDKRRLKRAMEEEEDED